MMCVLVHINVLVRGSDEPRLEHDIDPEIQAEIDECITYADALRAREIDARVVVEAVDREEIEMGTRGPVEVRVERIMHPAVPDDIPKPTQEEGAVEVTYKTLRDLGHMIVATGQQSAVLSERISELEELRIRREMRQIRHFRFYDHMRIDRLEACARRHLGYHP
ncbi:hypothetical protein Tco_1286477 [Tanacetum coccineum]